VKFYHLGLAADWEYDSDFLQIIEKKAKVSGLETLTIWPANLEDVYAQLRDQKIGFQFILDRASLSSPEFNDLIFLAQKQGTIIFDPPEKVHRAADKATMHLEFISQGILTPYTIILPPFEQNASLENLGLDLSPVGHPFVIKPASFTGGGMGVIKDGSGPEDIQRARQEFPQDKYLIQEKIEPKILNGWRFWFRVFFSWSLIQATWWNDETHLFKELTREEIINFSLQALFDLTEKIQRICELNFFSTEIVLDKNNRLVVVDYVNEICDMRLQSRHYDGVPDRVVENIAESLIAFIIQATAGGQLS